MKVIYSLLFLSLSIFCFVSCDNIDSEKSNSIPKIATMSNYFNDSLSTISTYQYDSQGRLSEMTAPHGPYLSSIKYTYLGDSVVIKITDTQNNTVTAWLKGQLNSKNQIISFTGLTNNVVTSTGTSEFNKEGFMIREVDISWPDGLISKYAYTIKDGNIVQEIDTVQYVMTQSNSSKQLNRSLSSMNLQSTITRMVEKRPVVKMSATQNAKLFTSISTTNYGYSDTLSTINDANIGYFFTGTQSRNLIRSFSSNGNNYVFTYVLDDKGRVYKQSGDDKNYNIYTYVE